MVQTRCRAISELRGGIRLSHYPLEMVWTPCTPPRGWTQIVLSLCSYNAFNRDQKPAFEHHRHQTAWAVPVGLTWLSNEILSPLGIPKSERVVWDNDCKLYYLLIEYVVKKFQLICLHIDGRDLPSRQRVFVALSRKSRQSTPNLGS